MAAALILAACDSTTLVDADANAESNTQSALPKRTAANAASVNKANINKALAAARSATAGYQQVSRAIADGFEPVSPCVEDEQLGGMGIHYANFANTGLDPAKPQILVYEPRQNGRLRLVAVEYMVPYAVVPADADAPRLFEEAFHPTPHLDAWTLHVWIWRDNPAGMFAEYNPKVTCDYAG